MSSTTIIATEEPRTESQNDKLWPGLRDIARQLMWPVDGSMQRLNEYDWKNIISAGLEKQRMAAGIEGGWVMLGSSTSRMSKRKFCELLTLVQHFGDSKQVRWTNAKWLAEVAAAEEWLAEEREKAEARAMRKAA